MENIREPPHLEWTEVPYHRTGRHGWAQNKTAQES